MPQRLGPVRGGRYGSPWRHAGMLLLTVVVFGPLAAAAAEAVVTVATGGPSAVALALPTGRRLSLLVSSIAFSVAVGTAAMAIGTLCGSALWVRMARPLHSLRWWLLVVAPVPPYVHALAWEVAGRWAWRAPVDGWVASWWVQTMALLPLAVAFVIAGLQSVDPKLVDAARVSRSDEAALLRVALPLAAPSIVAGGSCLAVLSLTDYSVPSLFHVNVYALDVFAEFSANGDPGAAFLVALPLLAVAGAVVLAAQSGLHHAATTRAGRERPWGTPPRWPRWLTLGQAAGLTVLAAQVMVPLISLVATARSWTTVVSAAADAGRDIGFTACVAGAAAGTSVVLCALVAPLLRAALGRPAFWWAVAVLPLSVPAPIVGVGLVSLWNHGWLPPIYGTWVMPVLAALARFSPLALLALLSQIRRLDPALAEAARLLDGRPFRVWARVELPLLAPAVLAASAIVLSLTVGELGATLIVTPPGFATLTLRVYNFLHYGAEDVAAALCLLMVAIVVGAGVLSALALGARPVTAPAGEDTP